MTDNLTHRKDFVLSKGHYFIQQPSEWETSRFQLGQEIRVADGAWDVESHVTVAVDDAPDLMDQIADYRVLPRYTDLLASREALQHILDRLNSPVYADGVFKGAILRELRMALKGEKIENV